VAATINRPYSVPRNGGSGRAIALAVLMHALLATFLFFGVRWQSSPPAVTEVELWSPTPQTAAPPPRAIPPPPRVEAPTPEPKVAPEPPQPKADIVEKAPVKTEPPKKVEPPKVEAPKPQPKPQPPAPKAEPKREVVKQPPKDGPPSDLLNILASASSSPNGAPTSTGKDQQTSGPRGRDSYIGRLQQAIRSQMRYPGSPPGNPTVRVRIEQLPTGEVSDVTIMKPSGVPAFDDAVDRAIRAASPLPRDDQGKVERTFTIDYFLYENKN
jgi:colicin import membrane protein